MFLPLRITTVRTTYCPIGGKYKKRNSLCAGNTTRNTTSRSSRDQYKAERERLENSENSKQIRI
jgi:hypothetical protein